MDGVIQDRTQYTIRLVVRFDPFSDMSSLSGNSIPDGRPYSRHLITGNGHAGRGWILGDPAGIVKGGMVPHMRCAIGGDEDNPRPGNRNCDMVADSPHLNADGEPNGHGRYPDDGEWHSLTLTTDYTDLTSKSYIDGIPPHFSLRRQSTNQLSCMSINRHPRLNVQRRDDTPVRKIDRPRATRDLQDVELRRLQPKKGTAHRHTDFLRRCSLFAFCHE